MRKIQFVTGETYHVFNRGVDKRSLFCDEEDYMRFFEGMSLFNTTELIGSMYEMSFRKERSGEPLVRFLAYCLNDNHYHFLLTQLVDGGISSYMKKLAGGYSWHFNNKYERSGALFQGPFKAVHVDSNEYLLHLSVYINLNMRCHKLGDQVAKFYRSSWREYIGLNQSPFIRNELVVDQFRSPAHYEKFALDVLPEILRRKEKEKEYSKLLVD